MNHPPTMWTGNGPESRRGQAASDHQWQGESVLSRLEDCLASLDRLGWTLPAAHLSQAVESVRERVLWSRIDQESGAEGVVP